MIVINGTTLEKAYALAGSKAIVCSPDGVDVKIGSTDYEVIPRVPPRAFFVANQLDTAERLNTVKGIVDSAAVNGFNLLMLSCPHFDNVTNAPQLFKNNLIALNAYCKEWGVSIAPICFSIGYGGAYTKGINKDFAAVYPCTMQFLVHSGQTKIIPDIDNAGRNIDFEQFSSNTFPGFFLQDGPGVTSFLDTTISHSGAKSCRFTDVKNSNGYGRLGIKIDVIPYSSYEVSFFAKCAHDWPGQKINLQATQTGTTRTLMSASKAPTTEWEEHKLQFNSIDCTQINVALGVWGGTTGSIWIDDITIKRQDRLQMIVERAKAPFTVRNSAGHVYTKGIDYTLEAVLGYPDMTYKINPVNIPDDSVLIVSYYRSYWRDSWGGVHALCMDYDGLQDHFDKQMDAIHDLIAPSVWQFSMDEIRQGAYDPESAHKTLGQSMADHLAKRREKALQLNPKALVLISGDMLDPSMNAVTPYASTTGFADSWKKMSKQVRPSVWSYDKKDPGIEHFISNGFMPFASINIDECTPAKLEEWEASLEAVGKKIIVRYTTWSNNYSRLTEFGGIFFN